MANILDSLSKVKDADVVMSVRDIKRTFLEGGQPLHILRGGGFDLHRGEIIALVGASGSGKSTLLQCVGLLDRPSGGSILIDGVAVQKMDEDMRTQMRRKKIGFVYQKHNLLTDFSALENVMLPMIIGPVIGDAACQHAAQTIINEVGAEVIVPAKDMFLWAGVVCIFALIPLYFLIKIGLDIKTETPSTENAA